MLTGAQLALAISAVLVAAIMLGWILHWIWVRLSRADSDTMQLAEMVDRLHEADSARDEAEDARRLAELLLATREAEMEARIARMNERVKGMVQNQDAERARMLRTARADAQASMNELRGARRRIAQLEAEIETLRRRKGG